MPDEFEPPEAPKTTESHKERIVGLIIAAIAVVLAIVTHLGNETNNDKILAHVDASDQFAFYQAKKERHAQLELQIDNLHLQFDKLSPEGQAQAAKLLTGYEAQMKHLEDDGREIKDKGDELLAESRHLQAKATFIELGEIALQIAVVLCSITILTEQNLFVRMGGVSAILGILLAILGGI
jgi:hypothetical protein